MTEAEQKFLNDLFKNVAGVHVCLELNNSYAVCTQHSMECSKELALNVFEWCVATGVKLELKTYMT